MTIKTEAIYANGVLRPLEPLLLREEEEVRITVESADAQSAVNPAAMRMIAGFDKMRLRTGGLAPIREELHERD